VVTVLRLVPADPVRDYNYVGGMETMLEAKFNIYDRVNIGLPVINTGSTHMLELRNNYVGLLNLQFHSEHLQKS